MAKHDENKDLRIFSQIGGKIDNVSKVLSLNKSTPLGIKLLSRIDFLTHHCGYTFIYNNSVASKPKNESEDNKSSKRELKKSKKEHPLSNKTRKLTKKKSNE